jgi:hypothetical protein
VASFRRFSVRAQHKGCVRVQTAPAPTRSPCSYAGPRSTWWQEQQQQQGQAPQLCSGAWAPYHVKQQQVQGARSVVRPGSYGPYAFLRGRCHGWLTERGAWVWACTYRAEMQRCECFWSQAVEGCACCATLACRVYAACLHGRNQGTCAALSPETMLSGGLCMRPRCTGALFARLAVGGQGVHPWPGELHS